MRMEKKSDWRVGDGLTTVLNKWWFPVLGKCQPH